MSPFLNWSPFLYFCFQNRPNSHQAMQLKGLVEDKLIKEGLFGVGVAVGVGALAAGLAAIMSRR